MPKLGPGTGFDNVDAYYLIYGIMAELSLGIVVLRLFAPATSPMKRAPKQAA